MRNFCHYAYPLCIAHYVSSSKFAVKYVIPTFFVVRLDKASTTYRLVVDGARQFQGTSINEQLLPGPSLIQHIHDVLLRFRTGNYAFTCDVSAMYLNVKVPLNDQPYLSIFFREHVHEPLRVVQLSSHPFGLVSSPYVAIRVVNKHAEERQEQFPLALHAVQRCAIVDDFIVSGDDAGALQQTRKQLQLLLQEIGMGLHKMATNYPKILEGVDPDKIVAGKTMGEEETYENLPASCQVKTLGIAWDSRRDDLAIQFQPKYDQPKLTLRQVVSDGGRLYDPLGLVLPIAIAGRLLQQFCWAESQQWDDVLPEDLQTKWRTWSQKTRNVSTLKFPRAIKTRKAPVYKQRLVVFVDASAEAQAAVAYVQTLYWDGKIEANLLTARGKVTSLRKQESIPRLECLAAALGAELAQKVHTVYGWNPDTTLFFSDSTTTLWWLRTPKPLKVFVANRVCCILDISKIEQWRYVHTSQNPADIPTRTASVDQLKRSRLWWKGPEFLEQPETQWPPQPPVTCSEAGEAEVRNQEQILQKIQHQHVQHTHEMTLQQVFLRKVWSKFSTARTGFRVATIVGYVINRLLQAIGRGERWTHPLTTPKSIRLWNWEDTEQCFLRKCIKEDQQGQLPEVLAAIQGKAPMPKRYECWGLYQDDEGLVRLKARLAVSQTVATETTRPIFLTKSMPMAKEIAKWQHEKLQHAGGPQMLLNQLRVRFWIEHGLVLAKQVLKQCTHCQHRKARKSAQVTAPLHYSREDAPKGSVFFSIGIDMFGPMEVTQGRGKPRGKRYGLIFTCGFSRAINVEVMRDATAESCYMAFKRHAAIYGQPRYINSDQGTNLLHMRKVMGEIHTAWEDAQPIIQHHYPAIKWLENPPYSPSYGGHYESLIKVLKNTFKHIARWPKYSFTDEQLVTGLKEAAAIANMRPLTELSSDPNDAPPLCPSDFLHAKVLGTTPDWRNQVLHQRVKNEMEHFQQELWQRMCKEVLVGLQRLKQGKTLNPLKTGDLVLYNNDEWRPDAWPLARVIETYPGKDGEKRVVKIRYLANHSGKNTQTKESIHSTKNLYKIDLPAATPNDRLLPQSA